MKYQIKKPVFALTMATVVVAIGSCSTAPTNLPAKSSETQTPAAAVERVQNAPKTMVYTVRDVELVTAQTPTTTSFAKSDVVVVAVRMSPQSIHLGMPGRIHVTDQNQKRVFSTDGFSLFQEGPFTWRVADLPQGKYTAVLEFGTNVVATSSFDVR